MSHFDLAFHYILKEALIHGDTKINLKKKFKAFRAQKIYGKNIKYLLVSSSFNFLGYKCNEIHDFSGKHFVDRELPVELI
jgi:hypothetical protein